jgi:spore coat polysaccharide biosynthesis protein SpsF
MNSASAIGIIQARLLSTRLPGKILLPLCGRPLLQVQVERLRPAPVDEWWLATSTDAGDDVTAAWGAELGLQVHRGPLEDVLARFTAIIERRRPRWVVRVTADDPFMDAVTVDLLLRAAEEGGSADVVHSGPALGFPLGFVPEVARAEAVLRAARDIPAAQPHHRAHVLSWLHQTGRLHWLVLPAGWPARRHWRWTVDTPEDAAMARAAFGAFGTAWSTITYPEMVAVLDARPDIVGLNAHIGQKPLSAA